MRVLVAASRKGGSGKTCCSRHLAVAALHAGISRVALIDLDPMLGLSRWWRRRPEDGIELVDLTPPELPRVTPEQRVTAAAVAADRLVSALPTVRAQGFGLLIIDTPPAADRSVRLAVAIADLVLVPVRPSPDDLDAVGETADVVSAAKRPMVFVINSATKKARLTGDAAIALSQHGTVAPAILHRSDSYAASALDGLTVQEADPRSAPAGEVTALWSYLAKRLDIETVNKHDNMITVRPALRVVRKRAQGGVS